MQWLTESMNDIISDIHYIVNRTYTDQAQFILQPFGTFLHSNAFHRNAGIVRTSFAVLNHYFDIQIMIFHLKSVYRGTLQSSLLAILNQVSIQVAGYTIV